MGFVANQVQISYPSSFMTLCPSMCLLLSLNIVLPIVSESDLCFSVRLSVRVILSISSTLVSECPSRSHGTVVSASVLSSSALCGRSSQNQMFRVSQKGSDQSQSVVSTASQIASTYPNQRLTSIRSCSRLSISHRSSSLV